MRTLSAAVCAVMVTCGVMVIAHKEPGQKPKVPRKGDEVVVKGCLHGAMLEATETMLVDESGSLITPYTFQLKGKKDLLKQLRQEHDGRLVELTGKLQSSLEVPGRRGTQIGRTGIFVGAGTSTTNRPDPGGDRIMPVLEVKSYEGTGASCRR
jgi:hypothetical protein